MRVRGSLVLSPWCWAPLLLRLSFVCPLAAHSLFSGLAWGFHAQAMSPLGNRFAHSVMCHIVRLATRPCFARGRRDRNVCVAEQVYLAIRHRPTAMVVHSSPSSWL